MPTYERTLLRDFEIANKLHVNAEVYFYEADANGAKTSTLATLYADVTGSNTRQNPQVLDSFGKLKSPCYIETAVIATITGLGNVPDYDTGVFGNYAEDAAAVFAAKVAAEAAAATAVSAAAEGMYRDIVNLTVSDSPYEPTAAQEGILFRVDTSGGDVTINLDELSDYGEDMKFAFVKATTDTNTITVNATGSDTIGAGTSGTISTEYEVNVFLGHFSSGEWYRTTQTAATIADNSVTTAKFQQIATATLLGRNTAGTGNVEVLTASQARTLLALGALALKDTILGSDITNATITGGKIATNGLNLSNLPTGTSGDILYWDGSGNPANLAKGVNGNVLGLSSGVPAWVSQRLVNVYIDTDTTQYTATGTTSISFTQALQDSSNTFILIGIAQANTGNHSGGGGHKVAMWWDIDGVNNAEYYISAHDSSIGGMLFACDIYQPADTSDHTIKIETSISGANAKLNPTGNTITGIILEVKT